MRGERNLDYARMKGSGKTGKEARNAFFADGKALRTKLPDALVDFNSAALISRSKF